MHVTYYWNHGFRNVYIARIAATSPRIPTRILAILPAQSLTKAKRLSYEYSQNLGQNYQGQKKKISNSEWERDIQALILCCVTETELNSLRSDLDLFNDVLLQPIKEQEEKAAKKKQEEERVAKELADWGAEQKKNAEEVSRLSKENEDAGLIRYHVPSAKGMMFVNIKVRALVKEKLDWERQKRPHYIVTCKLQDNSTFEYRFATLEGYEKLMIHPKTNTVTLSIEENGTVVTIERQNVAKFLKEEIKKQLREAEKNTVAAQARNYTIEYQAMRYLIGKDCSKKAFQSLRPFLYSNLSRSHLEAIVPGFHKGEDKLFLVDKLLKCPKNRIRSQVIPLIDIAIHPCDLERILGITATERKRWQDRFVVDHYKKWKHGTVAMFTWQSVAAVDADTIKKWRSQHNDEVAKNRKRAMIKAKETKQINMSAEIATIPICEIDSIELEIRSRINEYN